MKYRAGFINKCLIRPTATARVVSNIIGNWLLHRFVFNRNIYFFNLHAEIFITLQIRVRVMLDNINLLEEKHSLDYRIVTTKVTSPPTPMFRRRNGPKNIIFRRHTFAD